MENTKRAWLYCRVANGNLESMEAQRNELLRHVKSIGYEVVGESQDTGSGLCIDRKGIKEVSAAAMSGQMDVVLFKNLSCLGRDMLPTLAYITQLNQWGVEAVSITQGTIKASVQDEAVSHIANTMQIGG